MRFPHLATIERMTKQGSKYIFASAGTSKCFLQPIDLTSAQLFGITFSKGSVMYTPLDADIKESDNISINGIKYGVRGIQGRGYGRLAHKKIVLEQV